MHPRDLIMINLVCLVWGFNFVVTKWALTGDASGDFAGMPPLFLVCARFAIVFFVLAPLLRPPPRQMGKVFLIAMGFGALHFTLLYYGLRWTSASSAAVAVQLVAPLTMLLSILFLGERVGPWRAGGVATSFIGVALIAIDPQNFSVSAGVLAVGGAALAAAGATIIIKQLKDPPGPLRMQAWIALLSLAPLTLASWTVESGQWTALAAGGWRLWVALGYVAFLVGIFSHGVYYYLLRRYDASLVAPLTLAAPVWAVGFSVVLLGDPVTPQLIVGAALALGGVGVIALRERWRARQRAAASADGVPQSATSGGGS